MNDYDDKDGPPVCPRCGEECHFCAPAFTDDQNNDDEKPYNYRPGDDPYMDAWAEIDPLGQG